MGAEHLALEAIEHQAWGIAAMVQVGVGEHHGVDLRGIDLQTLPVEFAQVLEPLKQSAVDENPGVAVGEKVFGAGDGACTAKAGQ